MTDQSSTPTARAMKWLAACMVMCGAFLFVTPIALLVGPSMEARYLPVLTDWTVTSAKRDGNDLIISGTSVKWPRDCQYLGEIHAGDDTGIGYWVESLNAAPLVSRPASRQPYQWGPWRIRNGAGRRLSFAQSHQCHPLWTVTTRLGVYDDRQPEN